MLDRRSVCRILILVLSAAHTLIAQDADAGFDIRATLSGSGGYSSALAGAPRGGSGGNAAFRGVVYPTLKLGPHWSVAAAYQAISRPYYYESFGTLGYGIKGDLLNAALTYSRVAESGSLMFRAGQLSTAFGSFPLRYDSADNALVGLPIQYGYYYPLVSNLGLVGAQMDVTRGKWDARVQLANSNPSNPRKLWDKDQYGNWVAGGGYTVRQGLRLGFSASRGPYLDRQSPFFFPGEANPNRLPAHAVGMDAQWAAGHWNVLGEWQRFHLPYKAIPDYDVHTGYAEVRRVLAPRWYVAGRAGYSNASFGGLRQSYEVAVGFRASTKQLIKIGYQTDTFATGASKHQNTVVIESVTTVHPLSVGWK